MSDYREFLAKKNNQMSLPDLTLVTLPMAFSTFSKLSSSGLASGRAGIFADTGLVKPRCNSHGPIRSCEKLTGGY